MIPMYTFLDTTMIPIDTHIYTPIVFFVINTHLITLEMIRETVLIISNQTVMKFQVKI